LARGVGELVLEKLSFAGRKTCKKGGLFTNTMVPRRRLSSYPWGRRRQAGGAVWAAGTKELCPQRRGRSGKVFGGRTVRSDQGEARRDHPIDREPVTKNVLEKNSF